MPYQPMTFEGWLMSRFRDPYARLDTWNPNTPWQSQEVIDERTLAAQYNVIDLSLAMSTVGMTYAYSGSMMAATDSVFFYRLAQAPARLAPLAVAYVFHHGVTRLSRELGLPEIPMTSESFESDARHFGLWKTS